MKTDTLFLTLNTFSATGGIEKVCRIAGKAMYEFSTRFQKRLKIWSMHDQPADVLDNPYFPNEYYRGFAGARMHFVRKAVEQGLQSKLIILSHINLISVGFLVKSAKPSVKLVLICHGIEIWGDLPLSKKKMLSQVDEFWAVSAFTKKCIADKHGIDEEKIKILHNCLDPFLPLPKNVRPARFLRERYNIQDDEQVLLTVCRLSAREKYKGYDDVLRAIACLQNKRTRYLLVGKADAEERQRLAGLIRELGLEQQVIVPGFIPDEELASHFKLCDAYIMPSSKEGFGIVFIEAMYYGAPVIAGNEDGSVDALLNGALGTLVQPGNVNEIQEAISHVLNSPLSYQPGEKLLDEHFSFRSYKKNISRLVLNLFDEKQQAEALF